jgi:hypothetical protein
MTLFIAQPEGCACPASLAERLRHERGQCQRRADMFGATMCARCVILIIASAALEILGLGLVAWELWREQQRYLGGFAWFNRLLDGWLRRLGRSQATEVGGAATGADTAAGADLAMVTRFSPRDALDQRVEALEASLRALEDEQADRWSKADALFTAVHVRIDEVRTDLDTEIKQEEHERKEVMRESIRLQWVGSGLFALGALLGMWVNFAC